MMDITAKLMLTVIFAGLTVWNVHSLWPLLKSRLNAMWFKVVAAVVTVAVACFTLDTVVWLWLR